MPYNDLDLRQDMQYDILINKQRTFNVNLLAYYMSGTTEIEFDFSSYTGAKLEVKLKPDSTHTVLTFTTTDGSITLPATGGTFNLYKADTVLANVRAGVYHYDMYLTSITYPKRAFLSGTFTIIDRITI